MIVINTLAPLVLIVALGAILENTRFVQKGFFRQTNRLVFWVGLPCLLFYKTASPMKEIGRALTIFLVLFAGMILCIVIGYAVAFFLRLPRGSIGTFVQGAFRGNLAYVGLPIVLFALQELGNGADAIAYLVIAPLIPLYNAGAVFVLVAGREGENESFKGQVKSIIFRTATNPLFLSVIAGFLWSFTGWSMPLFAGRTLEGIGRMCLPLALLGVGASLNFESLKGKIRYAASAAIIKVGVAPLLGYLLGIVMGMTPMELRIIMIYLACPTALASFVMAEQMDADHSLASGIIVMTILLAVPALSIILLVT